MDGSQGGSDAMSDQQLIEALEQRSRQHLDRVIRLQGVLDDQPFELLIFRGFSSSTTHPTDFGPDSPVLPRGTRLESAELLKGPLNPAVADVMAGPMEPAVLLAQASW